MSITLTILLSYCFIQIFTLFCAGKDATSYLLKERNTVISITYTRIKRWHRDGVIIWAMFIGVLTWATHLYWQIPLMAVLIRLGSYDLGFNKWAQLPLNILGSTAVWDKIFIQIFGMKGAVKKSITFTILSIVFTYLIIK